MNDKPKYRYNWKTGEPDELVRFSLAVVSEWDLMRIKDRVFLNPANEDFSDGLAKVIEFDLAVRLMADYNGEYEETTH